MRKARFERKRGRRGKGTREEGRGREAMVRSTY